MSIVDAVVGLAGGLALFVYGVQMCSLGLQKMAARKLKSMVAAVTGKRRYALVVGTVTTLFLQSSSATSALAVGLIGAGAMTLAQAAGVLLGSAVGSSLTAQLIAFRTVDLALTLLFAGVAFHLFGRNQRHRSVGQFMLGFGLVFYGMHVMTTSMAPLSEYPVLSATLVALEKYPLLEMLAACIVTALTQSSAAFLALLIALASQGLLGSQAIIPFVLGAHLGGTISGLVSSLGAPGMDAKRAAIMNFMFKLVNALVFLPFAGPLSTALVATAPDVGRQVANAHTFFSIAMIVMFLPLTGQLARLVTHLVPDRKGAGRLQVHLDHALLSVPELAVDTTHRQILEMGNLIIQDMLEPVSCFLRTGNTRVLERIAEMENAVDDSYKAISQYIGHLTDKGVSDDVMYRCMRDLYAAADLEHIGDVVTSIAQILGKMETEQLNLSEEGLREVEDLYGQVVENFRRSLKALESVDPELASQVVKEHPRILRLDRQLRYSHFDRMQSGNARTRATSSIHLDLVEALLRVDNHSVSIAQGVMGII